MVDVYPWGGNIRKLWPAEKGRFGDHLLRLDRESRRMRFGHHVSDGFVEHYAESVRLEAGITYGYFEHDELRAAAELRKIAEGWGEVAEAAFSVESAYQNRGIATALMGRVIRAARNRGVRHLQMCCLAENSRMQAIAKKHEAALTFGQGEVVGDIVTDTPNYLSLFEEVIEDEVGFILAVLDLMPCWERAGSEAAEENEAPGGGGPGGAADCDAA